MSVKLIAFTCGTVTGEFARLMEGGEGDITVPIPVFLIEHPKGLALFDTGLHPDCQHDPAGRLGPRLAELFRIGFRPGEEVSARLEAIDRSPGKIDLVMPRRLSRSRSATSIPSACCCASSAARGAKTAMQCSRRSCSNCCASGGARGGGPPCAGRAAG